MTTDRQLARILGVGFLAASLWVGAAPAAAEQAAARPRRAVVTFDGQLEALPWLVPSDFEITAGKQRLRPARLYKPEEMPTVLALIFQDNQLPEFETQLDALREFILAQPTNTYIGVFYLSGQSVEPAILFDANLQKVAEALRTPKGQQELAPPSPYASIANMVTYMAQLPDARKEILWFAEGSDPSAGSASDTQNRALAQAVEIAQKAGVPVFVVYCSALPPPSQLRGDSNPSAAGIPPTPGSPSGSGAGSGSADGPSALRGQYNQIYLEHLAEHTGGKVFSAGKAATEIRPFLDEFRRLLALQYVVEYPQDQTIKKLKLRQKIEDTKLLHPQR